MPKDLIFILYTVIPAVEDAVLVLLFVRGLLLLKKRSVPGGSRIVSLSTRLLWIGFTAGAVFSVLLTVLSPEEISLFVLILFEHFILGGIALLTAFCNKTIVYGDEGFTVSGFFGKKRILTYGDLTGYAPKENEKILYFSGGSVRIDSLAKNGHVFFRHANRKYFELFKRGLPVRQKAKRKDPMRGNLYSPWLYIVIYTLIAATCCAFFAFGCTFLRPPRGDLPTGAETFEVSFSSYKEFPLLEGGTVRLYSPDCEKPFVINSVSGFDPPLPAPATFCKGEKYTVTVGIGKEAYFVYSIAGKDGDELFGYYDNDAAYLNCQRLPVIIFLIVTPIGAVLGILGLFVGRYPERFSSRFRRLFYKGRVWTDAARERIRMSKKNDQS